MKTENFSHTWNVAGGRLAVLLSVLLLSFAAKADFTKDYINYRVLENGDEVEVCGGIPDNGKLKIPEKVTYRTKTYTVTRIAENAFEHASVEYLEIPNTVNEIGAYAFSECRLGSVTIPPSIKVIGECAFKDCDSPASQEQEIKVQISDLAAWCDVDFADKYANPLSNQRSNLYLNRKKTYDLVIPDGVATIKQYAFCHNFLSVTFPPSVKEIGTRAISGYEYDYYDTLAIYLSDLAAWCNVTGDIPGGKNLYLNGEPVNSLIIPEGVKAIPARGFCGCESIESVAVPNTVIEIGAEAFTYCRNLKTAVIPNSVTEIKNMAFAFCFNLEKVTVGNSIKTIGDNAFFSCHLRDFFIANPVPPSAGNYCFYFACDYATLHIPKNSKKTYLESSTWSKFRNIVEYDASGIENVTSEEGIRFSVSGGVLTVTGVDGAMIEIYDMSGRRVYEGVSPVVSGLPRGIYLLKAGNRTAKIRI